MARCKHDKGNIQQFTEVCLDCGHNIYETDEEYAESLSSEIRQLEYQLSQLLTSKKIDILEEKKSALLEALEKEKNK